MGYITWLGSIVSTFHNALWDRWSALNRAEQSSVNILTALQNVVHPS